MPTVTPMPISDVLNGATSVVQEGLGWVTDTANVVTGTPILLMFCVVGFIGTGSSDRRRILS